MWEVSNRFINFDEAEGGAPECDSDDIPGKECQINEFIFGHILQLNLVIIHC